MITRRRGRKERLKKKSFKAYPHGKKEQNTLIERKFQKFVQNKNRIKLKDLKNFQHFQLSVDKED